MAQSSKFAVLLLAGASMLATSAAYAQEADEGEDAGIAEIVVTATKRESNVQDTAASISVRDGEALRTEGKFLLRDILETVPGITGGAAETPNGIAGGGTDTGGAGVVIRGLTSNTGVGGSNTAPASSVALYADDVYEGIGGTYDVEQVEILRGPQGTLYGRSATGGVVSIRTRNPDLNDFGVFGLAELGSDDLRHFSAALNVPVVNDVLAVRLSGDYYHRDGFDEKNGVGNRTSKNARIKVLIQPTENLSVLLGAALQDNEERNGGVVFRIDAAGNVTKFNASSPTPAIAAAAPPFGSGTNKFRQYWANIKFDLGGAVLTYIPAFRSWKQNGALVAAGPGFNINQTLLTPKDDFFTNELRLSSAADSKLVWQIGAMTYDNKLENTNQVNFAVPGAPLAFRAVTQRHTRQLGIFGEVTYPVTDSVRLTGGLRYDKTKVNVAQEYTAGLPPPPQTFTLPAAAGRLRFSNWTYKVRAEADVGEDNLLYASYSTGFSPGDASVSQSGTPPFPLVTNIFEDQTLKSFEIGSKNRFLDDTLQLNVALFHYKYSGYQTAGINTSPTPPIRTFDVLSSPLRGMGGELELLYQPTPNDKLALNMSYTDAKFVDRPLQFRTFIARQEIFQVPPFTANLFYSHRFELSNSADLTLGGDIRYLSKHDSGFIAPAFVGNVDYIRTGGVAIGNLNATLSFDDGKYTLSGYVRNVTDKRYFLRGGYEGPVAGGTVSPSAPRTFGVVAAVNF